MENVQKHLKDIESSYGKAQSTPRFTLFSIYDNKAKAYNPPFPCLTEAEANRIFTKIINDPKQPMHQNPEDYDLYSICGWDDKSGYVVTTFDINLVKTGLEVLRPVQSTVNL